MDIMAARDRWLTYKPYTSQTQTYCWCVIIYRNRNINLNIEVYIDLWILLCLLCVILYTMWNLYFGNCIYTWCGIVIDWVMLNRWFRKWCDLRHTIWRSNYCNVIYTSLEMLIRLSTFDRIETMSCEACCRGRMLNWITGNTYIKWLVVWCRNIWKINEPLSTLC